MDLPAAVVAVWCAVVLGVLHAPVRADVPSHCFKWQVVGTWDFKISSLSEDSSPLCGHTRPDNIINPYEKRLGYSNPGFEVEKTGYFTLKSNYSDEATLCLQDQCESAKWTMVYDEAMAIRGQTSGLELLFHFKYSPRIEEGVIPSGKDATLWMSHCGETFPGWFGSSDKRRGCAVAKNRVDVRPTPSAPLMADDWDDGSLTSLLQTKLRLKMELKAHSAEKQKLMDSPAFDPDDLEEQASLINKKQKFWVADASAASFASGFSMGEALRSVGGTHEKLLKPVSYSLDSIVDPNLKAKETHRRQCIRKVLPDRLDWSTDPRTNTPVINQGGCGSCYAVSSADAFSSRSRLKLGLQVSIRSSKAIFQCSPTNQGCDGGFPWLMGHHAYYEGLVADECAGPYHTSSHAGGPLLQDCNMKSNNCSSDIVYAKAWGYVGGYYGKGNTEDMMWSLFRDGPLVVAINAQSDLFMYKSGLYVVNGPSKKDVIKSTEAYWAATTHAIVLVGYGHVDIEGTPIESWKLKNSWGTSWGEGGYFNMQRGTDAAAVESMPVHAIFGDGKPGNPDFESSVRNKLKTIDDDSCVSVIEDMLAKELV